MKTEIKTDKVLIQTISAYPNMPWKMNFQIGLLPFLTLIWKKGTVLIVGDSVVSGLRESKMPFRRNIKVRFFIGARVQDMYNYLVPVLR